MFLQSTSIIPWLFKNIVFRSVALVTKKVLGYFRFFSYTDQTLLPCTLPYALQKFCLFRVKEAPFSILYKINITQTATLRHYFLKFNYKH